MILVSQLFQTTNTLQTFHGEVLASGLLSQTILPIASTPAISTSFRIFHMNKTNSTDYFTVPSLVNMQSFIRIRCKVRKQWNPKEMFAKRLMIVCISMRFNRRFHSHGSKKSACTDFDYCLLLEASKVITLIVDLLSVVIAVKYLFDISHRYPK